MNKQRIVAGALMLMCGMNLKAQMSSRIDQFFLDPSVLNPAAMGTYKQATASLYFNRMFSGVQGTPENVLANVVLPLPGERATFGLFYLRERAGFSRLQNAYATYAYRIPFSENTNLSLGVSLGFMNQGFDAERAVYISSSDPVLQALLFSPAVTRADLRASAMFNAGGFMGGMSFSRLVRPRFDYTYFNYKARYDLQNLANLLLGYDAAISEDVHLKPMVSLSTWDFNYWRFQGNLSCYYKDLFWGGISANDLGQLGFNVGVGLGGGTRCGYNYTVVTGGSKEVIGNGHEFFLSIGLGNLKKKSVSKSEDGEEESTVETDDSPRKKMAVTVASITDLKNAGLGLDTTGITLVDLKKEEATTPGFYLVAGVFSSEANANKMIKNLYMQDKVSFKFYDPKNKSFYVYVKYFKNRNEADKYLMGNETGLTQAWVREVK